MKVDTGGIKKRMEGYELVLNHSTLGLRVRVSTYALVRDWVRVRVSTYAFVRDWVRGLGFQHMLWLGIRLEG